MNILLIQGGWSTEREVSLAGCKGVREALTRLSHNVTLLDPKDALDTLPTAVEGFDFAFIGLHGSPGEDGLIQAMLERLRIPYQGADAAGSVLALDKNATKAMYRKVHIPTAPSVLLTQKPEPGWLPPFDFPIFIKPNTGGSSVHMERVANASDVDATLERLFLHASSYIVEQALTWAELTCGILGELKNGEEKPVPLAPVLIKAKNALGIFDYTSKYTAGQAEEICPAPVSPQITARLQEYALKAHTVLGLSGYSRSDFILTPSGEPVILETNTLPGMTPTSLLPQEAAVAGLNFDQLIARLIELGMARAKRLWG